MTGIEKYAHAGTNQLARTLYEAQFVTEQAYPYTDWDSLPEQAQEIYRKQAHKLLELYHVVPRLEGEPL